MVWGSSLRLLQPPNFNSLKCFKSPSVVGSKLSKEQLLMSKCINKVMFLRNSGMDNRFWQSCNWKIVKPTRFRMDSGSCVMSELMWSHFNWLKYCPKQDCKNVSLASSMMSICKFLILWNCDATTCCGSSKFLGNQMAWIFEVT